MTDLEIRQHNNTVLESLEKGDLVEFPRELYNHWAVYAGDEKVIHLTGVEDDGLTANVNPGSVFTISGVMFNKACVKIDDFWNVTGNYKAKKNNFLDGVKSPSQAEDIVKRAKEKLGEIGYNVLWSNCEHFATFCRYGESISDQVATALKFAAAGAVGGGLAYVLDRCLPKTEKHFDK